MKRAVPYLFAFLLLAAASRADEIRLKDGTKIVGTIVGFEDGSFKVQTSYGYALVRKDKIAAIIPAEPKPEAKKEAAAESKKPAVPAAAAEISPASAPAPKNDAIPAVARAEQPSAPPPAKAPAPKKEAPPAKVPAPNKEAAPPANSQAAPATAQPSPLASNPSAVKQAVPSRGEKPAAPAAGPIAKRPEPPPAPPPIRDEVQGNFYINHTYGFRMYKPPGWEILEDAQTALPSAIVAMGTGDETTLLVIGREHMKDPLETHAAAAERQLRQIYENYRRLSEHHTRVAGLPALVRRYRGTLGSHDWSGVLLSFARGNDVFTVLGMTYADSDLIQIQENVIAKTIASLEFTPQ